MKAPLTVCGVPQTVVTSFCACLRAPRLVRPRCARDASGAPGRTHRSQWSALSRAGTPELT